MERYEERWKAVEQMLEQRFCKLPDMEGILFLIGVNELDSVPDRKFGKEQKQDLMHIAVCTLLANLGYYEFEGRDGDGWPHYRETDTLPRLNMHEQEQLLKERVIEYFDL